MPRFEPFVGLRYSLDDLSHLVCPPYDVISEPERLALESLHDLNCVRLEVPQPAPGVDRYEAAAAILAEWRKPDGPLTPDDGPAFYVYRLDSVDDQGRPRQTTGVLGALGLEPPGEGILPHEHTTPKDTQDRLDLLRATRTNLSPIWGLSLASGLSALCTSVSGSPDAVATTDGVSHRLWRVTSPDAVEAIARTVGSAPVVVADGHHRFQVALAYQAQALEPAADAVLCFVVELSPDRLGVDPIHRLLSNLPGPVPEVFEPWFEITPTGAPDATILDRMVSSASLGLVAASGTWLLRPRDTTVGAAAMDLDSSRLDVALAAMPDVNVRFQHGRAQIVSSAIGDTVGVLLRPATVAQIAAVAHRKERMPPKTTFFTPKPATGMVFRNLDDQR